LLNWQLFLQKKLLQQIAAAHLSVKSIYIDNTKEIMTMKELVKIPADSHKL
jgi:hypothetical protein